jgi:beta-glucanase (GH16 family)
MLQRRLAALTLAAGVLLAGCVAAPKPASEPSASASAALKTTLALNPVDYGGTRVVVATFTEPVEGRRVELQERTKADWGVVASGTQDANGRVEFSVPYADADYRAVAPETADGAQPAVSTESVNQKDAWKLDFTEEFSQSSLATKYWSPRQTGRYFGSRLCSAPYPTDLKVKDGSLIQTVQAASADRAREVEGKAATTLGVPAAEACPNGVWDAAMVSTEGKYAFRYGVAAVRAKFPTAPGIHGSAWLQSGDEQGAEIDFIETFGPKYGIQHKLHYKENGKAASTGGYVKTLPEVKTDAWWADYHVFSVEWSEQEYVFRVDGVETFRTRKGVSKADEFIILSLLASDWELKRLDPAQMPATMAVDWFRVWKQK